jgi:hypothetical protein
MNNTQNKLIHNAFKYLIRIIINLTILLSVHQNINQIKDRTVC